MQRLILALSHIGHFLDPSEEGDRTVNRIRFLAYELQSLVEETDSASRRLKKLNEFFFANKGYDCGSSASDSFTTFGNHFILCQVLNHRSGSPLVLSLLYSFLAEVIGIRLEFVALRPPCFLKWLEGSKSRYIDLRQRGSILSCEDLILLLQNQSPKVPSSQWLESVTFEAWLSDYVQTVLSSEFIRDSEKRLYLQNILIHFQPNQSQLLGQRALLHHALGDFKSALADLKRYFSFQKRELAPEHLVELHDELSQF